MKKSTIIFTMSLFLAVIFLLPAKSKGQDKDKECKKHKSENEFNFSGVKVKHVGDDTVVIYINKGRKGEVSAATNWSTFPFCGKRGKFNGHWAGIDFGWNGYLTRNFDMNFPQNESFMNLNTARSLMINLNPLELNVNIAKQKFGFTTGLGFTLNNYYFSNSYTWIGDSTTLKAYNTVTDKGRDVEMKVNKLFVSYITLPLLLEYQTNPGHRISSFHITAGVIGGIRLQSYQKQHLDQYKETFYLEDANGTQVASFYADEKKIRNHNQYFLNPFKLDATMRIGWSYLNLFATYSLTPMFQKNKGPEVYPFSIGITLLGW